jgi:hypothetical protein
MVYSNRMINTIYPQTPHGACRKDPVAADDYLIFLGHNCAALFSLLAVSLIVVSVMLHRLLQKNFSQDQLTD